MESYRQICVAEELKRKNEALGMLQSVLMADSMTLHPCKAVSRDVVNQALLIAGLEPVIDREVNLI